MRTIVYIDGFNFYCGLIKHKNPDSKWLDLVKYSISILPVDYNLIKVKYFTALVNAHGDEERPRRQKSYWRALSLMHADKIEIIQGKFRTDPKFYRIALHQDIHIRKNKATSNNICVMKPEEKGSDVNLAVHIVNDAWMDLYDAALVISNDSDLAEALKIAKENCNKTILLLNPYYHKRSGAAKELNDLNLKQINAKEEILKSCLLPDVIGGTNVHKPTAWK